jgi:hypothetical protein
LPGSCNIDNPSLTQHRTCLQHLDPSGFTAGPSQMSGSAQLSLHPIASSSVSARVRSERCAMSLQAMQCFPDNHVVPSLGSELGSRCHPCPFSAICPEKAFWMMLHTIVSKSLSAGPIISAIWTESPLAPQMNKSMLMESWSSCVHLPPGKHFS